MANGSEVRVMMEGTLRFVRQSGSGRTWATASAPVSGLLAYVQSFSYTSAQTLTTIRERGVPDHHKITEKAPIDVTFQCLFTGQIPTAISGSGATVPMWALEFRASAAEIGNGTTGTYIQFHGAGLQDLKFGEAKEGDTLDFTLRALALNGPTGSGYLS